MKLFDRIFGDDSALAQMDRRAFLRGMAVTAAGIVIPAKTIFLPVEPMVRPATTSDFAAVLKRLYPQECFKESFFNESPLFEMARKA